MLLNSSQILDPSEDSKPETLSVGYKCRLAGVGEV